MTHGTRTDPGSTGGWIITDAVTCLRELGGTGQIYPLPAPPIELILGSDPTCHLQLTDRRVSRQHARIAPYESGWKLYDLGGKNGLWRNGHRRRSFALSPGDEIGLGRVTLRAESPQLAALLGLLCRYLGWQPNAQKAIDDALRSLRDWAALRHALMLSGDGDLSCVASRLHAACLGRLPFVPRDEGAIATHGSLWVGTLPSDLSPLVSAQGDGTRVLLRVHRTEEVTRVVQVFRRAPLIELPSLSSRHHEIAQILEESCADAAIELGAPPIGYMSDDIRTLSQRSYQTFVEVEADARKLVAVHAWGVYQGAKVLGIDHGGLSKWRRRWLGGS